MFASQASTQSLLNRVRRDLNSGNFSRIEDYLAAAGENASSILPDLVAMKLAHRLRHGENASAREYLSRFPETNDPAIILRWIGVEYRTIRETGVEVSEESFRERYPEWADHPQWSSFVSLLDPVTRDGDAKADSTATKAPP